ncbi:MAG: hypothetical protein OEY49_08195 [Candidatus Heimdallarchaeota archaeon]|nr:hypothetical protein [Candidatus Heimdallarchaeota archaeon]
MNGSTNIVTQHPSQDVVYWMTRSIGLFVVLITLLLSLDVFEEGYSVLELIIGFTIHLIPTLIISVSLYLGWKNNYRGMVIFAIVTFMSITFVTFSNNPSLEFYLTFGLPPFLISIGFLISWRREKSI